jgi:hypothetical protein
MRRAILLSLFALLAAGAAHDACAQRRGLGLAGAVTVSAAAGSYRPMDLATGMRRTTTTADIPTRPSRLFLSQLLSRLRRRLSSRQ